MAYLDTALNRVSGITWAYRLFLDRLPSDEEVASVHEAGSDLAALTRSLMDSREFVTQLERPTLDDEIRPEDRRDAVIWAFKLLLGRELTNEGDIDFMASHHPTVSKLRNALLLSEEFRLMTDQSLYPLLASSVVREFKPICKDPPPAGSFRDFLGDVTQCRFLPATYMSVSGKVLGPPGAVEFGPLHDTAEWVGTLRSVLEASERFTVVELGAGWAPWLVAGHNAATRRGITDIHLLGVEGSAEHVEYMRQNFVDNGLDPDAHHLIHGVVGTTNGIARFPKLERPGEDYGAAADYAAGASVREMVEVPCFSLETLLRDLPPVIDLIHCDVQGGEADVMAAALPTLNARVRRVVIGTHGRRIEGLLLEQFSQQGWRLEHEGNCMYHQAHTGDLVLYKDGEQVWRNTRL